MLIEERFQAILDIVNSEKSITVQELTERLNTSESTIRRDLTQLHKQGRLIKVHGGATSLNMNYDMKDAEIGTRYNINREEKMRIARYAASLVMPNDFIFIDAGTTTELIADYLTEMSAVYVTNSVEIAIKLMRKGCNTYILGGELKSVTGAAVGIDTVEAIRQFNFTKGFWGTNGISLEDGYTTPDISEALVKRKSLERCADPYIVADSSKFAQISPVSFADYENATIITTTININTFRQQDNIIEIDRK